MCFIKRTRIDVVGRVAFCVSLQRMLNIIVIGYTQFSEMIDGDRSSNELS